MNVKLIILIFIGIIAVSCDLISTKMALVNPNNYEGMIFGNIPMLEYLVNGFSITLCYYAENKSRWNHYISLILSLMPFIATIHNLTLI